MTQHVMNLLADLDPSMNIDPLCGAVTHPGDGVWNPKEIDDEALDALVDCGDCHGLLAQLTALAAPSDNMRDDTLTGYRDMAAEFGRVVHDHTIRTPEALTELARARRHENIDNAAPASRGARTACERVMYPLGTR